MCTMTNDDTDGIDWKARDIRFCIALLRLLFGISVSYANDILFMRVFFCISRVLCCGRDVYRGIRISVTQVDMNKYYIQRRISRTKISKAYILSSEKVLVLGTSKLPR